MLDRYIVGQGAAKKAVANALRNRWRRHKVPSPLRVSGRRGRAAPAGWGRAGRRGPPGDPRVRQLSAADTPAAVPRVLGAAAGRPACVAALRCVRHTENELGNIN